MARILYLSHDTMPPTGGMRTIYAHVGVLRAHGFDAAVVHQQSGFRPQSFPADVPVVYGDRHILVDRGDVLVVPETYVEALAWAERRRMRRVVFCQNQFYSAAGRQPRRGQRYWGAETVLCGSRAIAGFLAENYGWSALPVVPYAIDGTLFRPRPKAWRIVYMPRKRPFDAALIRLRFRVRFPRHADVPFIAIQGMGEDRVAEMLGEAAIFLSLAYLEGFGLSALEALSAEAAVAGFHGEGGREYATAENGMWVEEGEIERCVAALADLADRVKASDPSIARMRVAGRAAAATYSPAARDAALVAFWRGMVGDEAVSGPSRRAAAPVP